MTTINFANIKKMWMAVLIGFGIGLPLMAMIAHLGYQPTMPPPQMRETPVARVMAPPVPSNEKGPEPVSVAAAPCPPDVLNGPASLARGWRWESDKELCLGFALPDGWEVSRVEFGIKAIIKGAREGEWASVGLGIDRSIYSCSCGDMPGLISTSMETGITTSSGRDIHLDFSTYGQLMTIQEFDRFSDAIMQSIRAD